MSWARIAVYLSILAALTTALSTVVGITSPHIFAEPNLSTRELLSENWWHRVLRLAITWLWLFAAGSVALGLILWLAAGFQRAREAE